MNHQIDMIESKGGYINHTPISTVCKGFEVIDSHVSERVGRYLVSPLYYSPASELYPKVEIEHFKTRTQRVIRDE